MKDLTFIGVDPDSQGLEAVIVRPGETKTEHKHFSVSTKGLSDFVNFLETEKEYKLIIEGANGQSQCIESVLQSHKTVFYSLPAYSVSNYRKATFGQNKNNRIDAESVANFARSLYFNNKLEQYRRLFFPDRELQKLTRRHSKKTKDRTAEVNELWIIIKEVAPDLYLMLHNEYDTPPIQNVSFLSLLNNVPDIGSWKRLDEKEILNKMHVANTKHVRKLIKTLKSYAPQFSKVPDSYQTLLQDSADQILKIKDTLRRLEKVIKKLVKEDLVVTETAKLKGISVITAAKMVAEVIDCRRFANNNKLAAYAGLCRKSFSTGNNHRDKSTKHYNHRLKDLSITAVKNFIMQNKDSQLAGYFRYLTQKRKMKKTEAYKRCARALIRRLYKLWKATSLVQLQKNEQTNVASSVSRKTISYTSPAQLKHSKKEVENQEKIAI